PAREVLIVKMACLLLPALLVAAGPQKNDKDAADTKRPRLTLKAQPVIAMSPARVVLTAELLGGPNDYEEFYCAAVEWDWGDGTQSEPKSDCDPYQPGKSEIKRRFTVDHIFRAGYYQVAFRLKQRDKAVASATTTVQVQAGIDELRR